MQSITYRDDANSIMRDAKTGEIREAIRIATEQERQSHTLRKIIESQIPMLHEAIRLPKNNAADALLDFVLRYISHVPNFIDAIGGLTKEAGIYQYASIFLRIAEDFFIKPPEVIADHSGLEALLDEAYLAHRLIEEVNDRIIARYSIPLAPMDMTRANLIVHQLIGEPYANQLDFAVFYSTEINLPDDKQIDGEAFRRYVDVHKNRGWGVELGRWPCLAEDLEIDVNFSNPTPSSKKSRLFH